MKTFLASLVLAFSISNFAFADEPQPTKNCPHGLYKVVEAYNANATSHWKSVKLSTVDAIRVAKATGISPDLLRYVESGEWIVHLAESKTKDFIVVSVEQKKNGCYIGSFPAEPQSVAEALTGRGA